MVKAACIKGLIGWTDAVVKPSTLGKGVHGSSLSQVLVCWGQVIVGLLTFHLAKPKYMYMPSFRDIHMKSQAGKCKTTTASFRMESKPPLFHRKVLVKRCQLSRAMSPYPRLPWGQGFE